MKNIKYQNAKIKKTNQNSKTTFYILQCNFDI